VALNDTLALGAFRAVQERGLLPGRDLSIVGFDDVPMALYVWPPLTSIRQPVRLAGRKCVEILVNLLEGQPPAITQVLLAPELVVRQSSGVPPSSHR
jgi:DNA-binding LacI/PurR family transcriptional regulator